MSVVSRGDGLICFDYAFPALIGWWLLVVCRRSAVGCVGVELSGVVELLMDFIFVSMGISFFSYEYCFDI
jgi:hypothetical protein